MYSCVIWDWNGTLLDDLSLCNQTVNRLLESRGLAPLSRERYYEVFCFPIEEYYAAAGFDFNKDPYPVLAREFMEMYVPASKDCGLVPGARCALDHFAAVGVKQVLLTASDTDTLSMQMQKLGVEDYFCEVIGQDNIYAVGKAELARRWMERMNIQPGQMLLVGDTRHDAEIAAILGCDCALITRGHHNAGRLQGLNAHVYTSLFALLRELTGGMPRGCVFDMDGTILHTIPDIAAAVNACAASYGLPPFTLEQVRQAICHGVRGLLGTLFPEQTATADQMEETVRRYRGYYSEHLVDHSVPYSGIFDILSHLERMGIPAAVQSNKSHAFVGRIAAHFFPDRFMHVAGLRDDWRPKPAPDGAHAAARDMGLPPAQVCYVGDSEVDVATARNAGMRCLAVDWGYRTREELKAEGATLIFSAREELLAFLGDESALAQ